MWSCSSSGVDLRGSAGGSIHFAASAAADFCDLDRRLKKSVKVINKNNNFNKSERSSQRGESRLRWRCCSSTFTHADPFSATAAAAGICGIFMVVLVFHLCFFAAVPSPICLFSPE